MAEKKQKAKGFNLSPTAKKILIGVGIGALVIVLCAMGAKINKLDKTEELSTTFGYERGLIAADGSELKGTTSIRTKDFIPVDGLKVDLVSDASVTYQIFWYDEEEGFISATEELAADFDSATGTVPEGAENARIMVTPENDPEVSASEISDYAEELTVEWNK